jgi:hypothetical protein
MTQSQNLLADILAQGLPEISVDNKLKLSKCAEENRRAVEAVKLRLARLI